MQGASPLASPGLNPRGIGSPYRCGKRNGGLPPAALAIPAAVVPGGGACLSPRLPTLPLVYFPAPYPPAPLPSGKGENQSFLMQGASPLASPGLNPRGTGSPCQFGTRRGVPSESPTRRNTERTAFPWEVPAAKERGDRGRGTSAFEMVLSPGAGIASAAGVQLSPPCPPPGTWTAGRAGAAQGTPPPTSPLFLHKFFAEPLAISADL